MKFRQGFEKPGFVGAALRERHIAAGSLTAAYRQLRQMRKGTLHGYLFSFGLLTDENTHEIICCNTSGFV
ncbi:hypothetical protein EDD64_10981 [Effusibacillus lacus]|nr:hypothetical protein EDD64_10981 [Effusibacillus lacus]